jgi:two-component system, cell cycle response regulator
MSARVLVVDDVAVNVKLLEAKLTSQNFNVITAHNGAAGLELARREWPDIVLLDVMMPQMDGFEVCRRLKADPVTSDIPIVMVSALSGADDRALGLEAGADDFLTKPVNDVALFTRVRSLVRLKRLTDDWRRHEETYGCLVAIAESRAKPTHDAKPARVVILEDRPLSAQRILETLSGEDVRHAARAADVLEQIASEVELFVLALSEEEDILRLVADLRTLEAMHTIPILLIGEDDELPLLAKGLDLGAADYLLRPIERNELIARVRAQVRCKRLQDRLGTSGPISGATGVRSSVEGYEIRE